MGALKPSSSSIPPFPSVASHGFAASNGLVLPQNEYADRLDSVAPDDWGSLGDSLDDQTLNKVRGAIGQLAYLAYGTRPDLAAWIGDIPTSISQLTYQGARALNDTVKMAKQTAGKQQYCIKNDVCVVLLHLVRFADCAFGGEDGKSRSGDLLTPRGPFPGGAFQVLSWSSRVLRRVIRCALGGGVLSFRDTYEFLADVKLFYGNVFGGSIPVNVVTDCKPLSPHLRKGSSPSERLPKHG